MRIKVVTTDTYAEAAQVRNRLVKEYPDRVFQIRKLKPDLFSVVERKRTEGKKRGNSL